MHTAELEPDAIGLLSRVVVQGRTPVGGRLVTAPEGKVIERGESGLFRVGWHRSVAGMGGEVTRVGHGLSNHMRL